jgi:hypothetical protein
MECNWRGEGLHLYLVTRKSVIGAVFLAVATKSMSCSVFIHTTVFLFMVLCLGNCTDVPEEPLPWRWRQDAPSKCWKLPTSRTAGCPNPEDNKHCPNLMWQNCTILTFRLAVKVVLTPDHARFPSCPTVYLPSPSQQMLSRIEKACLFPLPPSLQ